MSILIRTALLSTLLCAVPDQAWAWGAGVHLGLGLRLLSVPDALPAAVQALLNTYPLDFLYGTIAADIVLGKKYTHHLEHCHNWRIGHKILRRAGQRGPQAEACAYGYLSHLAADTIAHNYFVPYKLAMTYNTIMHNHAYWEIRADIGVRKETWAIAEKLAKRDNRDLDKMLSGNIADTLFSFATNKKIFNSMMMVSRLRRWRKTINTMAKHSKWPFDSAEHQEYMAMALIAITDILSDPDSPYWQADPTGERALAAAQQIRKNLNHLWLEGKLHQDDAELILSELRNRLKLGITDPDELLPLFTAV